MSGTLRLVVNKIINIIYNSWQKCSNKKQKCSNKNVMRHILMMGSGAVGGYYGAYLSRPEGTNVTFIARGAHFEALKSRGLRITGKEELKLDTIRVLDHPSQLKQTPDLVIITVKSFDTEHAIEQLRPVVDTGTLVLTLQNGLENYEQLVNAFGARNVIRGFCKIGVEVTEPGVIDYRGLSRIFIGEEDGSISNRMLQLQNLFEYAGIRCEISRHIRKDAWLKFIWNGIFNMMTGLTGVTVNYLFEDDDAYAVAWQLFHEIQAVARAEGVFITEKEGAGIINDTKRLGAFRTSTSQDRLKGKTLEFDVFCGYIVRKGKQHGLKTTANRTLFSLYKMLAKPESI